MSSNSARDEVYKVIDLLCGEENAEDNPDNLKVVQAMLLAFVKKVSSDDVAFVVDQFRRENDMAPATFEGSRETFDGIIAALEAAGRDFAMSSNLTWDEQGQLAEKWRFAEDGATVAAWLKAGVFCPDTAQEIDEYGIDWSDLEDVYIDGTTANNRSTSRKVGYAMANGDLDVTDFCEDYNRKTGRSSIEGEDNA